LSFVFIVLGTGFAGLATRAPARQALCEAVGGALLITGLLILGAALSLAR
jgi:hypothetical protein